MPVMWNSRDVLFERNPASEAEPVICPYLGLPEDQRTRFAFATPAHRCHVKRKPGVIDLQHQGQYCLTSGFTACPRFRAPASYPVTTTPDAIPRIPTQPRPVISVLETSRPAADLSTPVVTANSGPVPSILRPVPEPGAREDSPGDLPPDAASRRSRQWLVRLVILVMAVLAVAIVGFTLGAFSGIDPLTVSTTPSP